MSLSYMDRLRMDHFSPTFHKAFVSEHKMSINCEIFNFLFIRFTIMLSSHMFSLVMISACDAS